MDAACELNNGGPETPSLLMLIRRIYLLMSKHMERTADELGLTTAQIFVLGRLYRGDGAEQRALCDGMGVTSPTLTGIMDGLVKRGYVERRLHPDDARVKQLYLTEAGRALGARLHTFAGTAQAQVLAGFSQAEVAALTSLLERIAANLESFPLAVSASLSSSAPVATPDPGLPV
jgi:MarR family transcriptional regulator for hemolysin